MHGLELPQDADPSSGFFSDASPSPFGGLADGEVEDLQVFLPSDITITKVLDSVTAIGSGQYDVAYTLTVENNGQGAGRYSLSDAMTPDGDVVVDTNPSAVREASSTSSSVETVDGTFGAGVLIIVDTDAGIIEVGTTDIFTVTATVHLDLSVDDGVYTACSSTTGVSGEGLFNRATLVDADGTKTNDACGDIPAVSISKTYVNTTPSATAGEYDVKLYRHGE